MKLKRLQVLIENLFDLRIKSFICVEFTNKNRKSPLFNHLSAISEGIPALGWILIAPTPGPHIKDMTDAAQFYSNRVLKEFKDKDPTHTEWVKLWVKVLNDLYTYVRQHHTTGLAWASQGKRDFGSVNTTTVKPVAGGPPPPPPPPPPMLFDAAPAVLSDSDQGRNDLMNSINALGQGVTSHLKKVPDDLKTHKNPQLRRTEGMQNNFSIVSYFNFLFRNSFSFSWKFSIRKERSTSICRWQTSCTT